MGRKKIEIEKLSNRETLKVTFSKRRVGLYRKASALCTSCGAHVASIAFSPGNNPFVFGHPSVLRRFLREEDGDGDHDNNLVESEGGGFCWDLPIEGLKLEELRSLKQSLEKLKKDVVDRFQEMSMRKHSDRNCLFGLIDSWPYLL